MTKQGYVVFIEMDHEETGCMAVEWIQLAQNHALVNTLMNVHVFKFCVGTGIAQSPQ